MMKTIKFIALAFLFSAILRGACGRLFADVAQPQPPGVSGLMLHPLEDAYGYHDE